VQSCNTSRQRHIGRHRFRFEIPLLLSILAAPLPLGCAAAFQSATLSPGSGAGVTVGGVQDIAYARQVIEDGGVPPPDSITVQGLLSEHSIEIATPPEAGLLFSTAAAAWGPHVDAASPLATAVIGFGSTINREIFKRPPLNLALIIDG